MKERIDTIPVNEAFGAGEECPFCHLERQAEQRVIRYTLGPGASYMEPEVRAETDRAGFCGAHLKKMYDYGNSLGNALILETYMNGVLEELEKELDNFELPAKRGLFSKKQPEGNRLAQWTQGRLGSCHICSKVRCNMERYYHTFFVMVKDAEFRGLVERSKGFCLNHFGALVGMAEENLPGSQREWFYGTVSRLMKENLGRVKGELDWFIAKFDYRNASADWKNSRDAVSRMMQKIQGGYVADPPYTSESK